MNKEQHCHRMSAIYKILNLIMKLQSIKAIVVSWHEINVSGAIVFLK